MYPSFFKQKNPPESVEMSIGQMVSWEKLWMDWGVWGDLEALRWMTFSWRFRAEICVRCGGPQLDFSGAAWIVHSRLVSVWLIGKVWIINLSGELSIVALKLSLNSLKELRYVEICIILAFTVEINYSLGSSKHCPSSLRYPCQLSRETGLDQTNNQLQLNWKQYSKPPHCTSTVQEQFFLLTYH